MQSEIYLCKDMTYFAFNLFVLHSLQIVVGGTERDISCKVFVNFQLSNLSALCALHQSIGKVNDRKIVYCTYLYYRLWWKVDQNCKV
jgi:hypothetical protein